MLQEYINAFRFIFRVTYGTLPIDAIKENYFSDLPGIGVEICSGCIRQEISAAGGTKAFAENLKAHLRSFTAEHRIVQLLSFDYPQDFISENLKPKPSSFTHTI